MLNGIKSKYILQQILNNLYEGKKLQLVKYNKKLKEKLNIKESDFRKFTQIEIEIILNEIKEDIDKRTFEFINYKDEDKHFYHIYFDNGKNEVKRNYVKYNETINEIKIVIEMEIKSLNGLFYDCGCVKFIKFTKFERKDITDFKSLFENCLGLSEVDLKTFKTKNAKDMSYMFYNCSSLTNVDLSSFTTENVTKMNNMFSWCGNLTKIDLKNFNTEKVIDMHEMFSCCYLLQEVDISSFNFNNVNNLSYMFSGCESLINIETPLNKFNLRNNINIREMFSDCNDELKEKIKQENKNIKEEAFALILQEYF